MTVGLSPNQGEPDVTVNQMVNGFLSIDVAGGTDVTLSDFQATYAQLEFTGVLTSNINVDFPDVANITRVYNNTTGAFTLTCRPLAGSGVAITQGNRETFGQDGSGTGYLY